MAAGTVLPSAARAADDCSQMFVYSVNQFCRTLSNGFSQCQPVGMVGPAPNCAKPGVPPIMPVPLAPPVTQAPRYNYMLPFTAPQAAVSPAAAQPAAPAAAPAAAAQSPAPAVAPAPEGPKAATAPAVAVTPAPKPEVVATPIAPPAMVAAPAPEKPQAAAVPAPAAAAPAAAAPAAAAPATAAAPAAAPAAAAPTVTAAPPAPSPIASPPQTAAPVVAVPAEPAKPAPHWPAQLVLQDGLAHFEFDRAELSEKARAELDAWLSQPIPKGKTLRVTGHADRLGPAAYNLKLSGRRALTVKKYLVGKGVEGRDIKVVAKGESEPVKYCKGGASKATIACLAPNRRVEIDPE